MLTPDIQKKVSLLQLHVKKILRGLFAGDCRSRQKGYGIEFEQLRDYQLGDDIRFIDWKSTARANKTLVKEYLHEHSKTILLAVDISNSIWYGSSDDLKKDFIAQIVSVLALAADYSKARVGLVLFADEVKEYISPGSGAAHCAMIISKLWSISKPEQYSSTNIAAVFKFLTQISKKDTMLFFISDFIDAKTFEKELAGVAQRYDMIVIRCLDNLEAKFLSAGFIHVQDCETGDIVLLDARRSGMHLSQFLNKRLIDQENLFKKCAIDYLDLKTNNDFIDPLLLFFAHRLSIELSSTLSALL